MIRRDENYVRADVDDPSLVSNPLDAALHVIGQRRRLLVTGESGSGKTWFLEQLASEVRHSHLLRAFPGGEESPFGLVAEILGEEESPSAGTTDWVSRFNDVLQPGSVVLIDDVGWADHVSLSLLSKATSAGRISLVMAGGGLDLLEDHPARRNATVFRIPRLTQSEAKQLLIRRNQEVFRRWPDLEVAIAGAGGNPGLLIRMVEFLETSQAAGVRPLPTAMVPHLQGIPECPRELLELLAVADQPVRPEAIAAVLGLPEPTIVTTLRDLDRAGLVSLKGQGAAIAIPWIADSILAELPSAVGGYLHRGLAEVLQNLNESPAAVARHLLAGEARQSTVIPWLLRAADETMSSSPAEAVDFLSVAVEIQRRSAGPLSSELIGKLSKALVAAGRPGEAAGLTRTTLLRSDDPAAALPLSVTLAEALWLGDRLAESVAEIEQAGRAPNLDDCQRATLEARRSIGLVLSGQLDAGAEAADSALAAGRRLGADVAVSLGLSAQAHLAYYAGDVTEALRRAESACEAAERSPSEEDRRRARYDLGMFSIHADKIEAAIELFRSERFIEARSGPTWYQPIYTIGLGIALFTSGDWSQAARELEDGLALAAGTGILWESAAARAYLAAIRAHRGDAAGARTVLDALPPSRRDTPHHSEDALMWARALTREAEGDTAGALELFERSYALVERFNVFVRLRWLAPDLIRVAVRLDQCALAVKVHDQMNRIARHADVPYITAISEHCGAMISGDAEAAERAVQLLRSSRRPLELATAAENAGRLFCQRGETRHGLSLYAEALAVYGQLGAGMDSARVRNSLDSLGAASAPEQSILPADLAQLTASENRTAQMAARGLTNAEIARKLHVSPRTVEVHLTRTFAKLGLRSRVELAAKLPRWTS